MIINNAFGANTDNKKRRKTPKIDLKKSAERRQNYNKTRRGRQNCNKTLAPNFLAYKYRPLFFKRVPPTTTAHFGSFSLAPNAASVTQLNCTQLIAPNYEVHWVIFFLLYFLTCAFFSPRAIFHHTIFFATDILFI